MGWAPWDSCLESTQHHCPPNPVLWSKTGNQPKLKDGKQAPPLGRQGYKLERKGVMNTEKPDRLESQPVSLHQGEDAFSIGFLLAKVACLTSSPPASGLVQGKLPQWVASLTDADSCLFHFPRAASLTLRPNLSLLERSAPSCTLSVVRMLRFLLCLGFCGQLPVWMEFSRTDLPRHRGHFSASGWINLCWCIDSASHKLINSKSY